MKKNYVLLFMAWAIIAYGLHSQNNHHMENDLLKQELLFVEINEGVNIAYTDTYNGVKVLLFIHGLGSNHKAWQKNIDELSTLYRCIAIDLPGYGASSSGEFPYSMVFFSEVVQEFIIKMDLQRVHLVGHSMGGQIAMTLALENPELIESLILIAPAGIETFNEHSSSWLKQVFSYEFLKNLPEGQIIKNFEINFYEMPDDARFMIEDRFELKATGAYDDYCRMIPQCVAGMLDGPVFDQLHKIRLPVLVLYGENDKLIPNTILHPELTVKDIANKAKSAFSNGEMHMLDKAGHFLQWEKSKEVNTNIKKFLRNLQ